MDLLTDTDGPYCTIEASEAFDRLDKYEKRYAHHMARAAWAGTRILLRQTSAESVMIYDLLLALSQAVGGRWESLVEMDHCTPEELRQLLEYFAMFLANVGNYRSQGNSKFIPRLPHDRFASVCSAHVTCASIWEQVGELIYSAQPSSLGWPSREHGSGYYPGQLTITEQDVIFVQQSMDQAKLLPENTRVSKHLVSEGHEKQTLFEVMIASSERREATLEAVLSSSSTTIVRTQHGDHAVELSQIVSELSKAMEFSSRPSERSMLKELIGSLRDGDMQSFKQSLVHWIENRSPVVEISHGFIESYQDPQGIRASWQGLVAVVNRAQSEVLSSLVDNATDIIAQLPWNNPFGADERDNLSVLENPGFVRPEFVSLDVIAFCNSEIWSGLNLPNFEDICQSVGSKNLNLGNVIKANPPNEKIPFVPETELPLVQKLRDHVFDLSIACHELLGHGSGRLLSETSTGDFNFDHNALPIDPQTGNRLNSWYAPQTTWQTVFREDAASLEECRADGVALYLSCNEKVLSIFNVDQTSKDDFIFVSWLHFCSGALKGLSTWDPTTRKWGQAHKRGQFAILQCLLEPADDLIRIDSTQDTIAIHLDRSRILSHGIPRLGAFLTRLQIYKSTAQRERMKEFYDRYTTVNDSLARLRNLVIALKPNRIQYVQPNTFLDGEDVVLREYPATKEGLIQSWVEREEPFQWSKIQANM